MNTISDILAHLNEGIGVDMPVVGEELYNHLADGKTERRFMSQIKHTEDMHNRFDMPVERTNFQAVKPMSDAEIEASLSDLHAEHGEVYVPTTVENEAEIIPDLPTVANGTPLNYTAFAVAEPDTSEEITVVPDDVMAVAVVPEVEVSAAIEVPVETVKSEFLWGDALKAATTKPAKASAYVPVPDSERKRQKVDVSGLKVGEAITYNGPLNNARSVASQKSKGALYFQAAQEGDVVKIYRRK